MRGDTMNLEPIFKAANGGSTRARGGGARVPSWNRPRIGLLLLGIITLTWLPIGGNSDDAASARRVRGLGDSLIQNFAFAPDGATIATIRMDERADLRDAVGGKDSACFLDYRGLAGALAFAPDGQTLVVGGSEPDIFRYDSRTGGAGHPLGVPIRWTTALAFSPDGRTLAVSSDRDHEILLWDLTAGRERARLRGHQSPAIKLAFSPDGRTLASGSRRDSAILLWDLATGRPGRRLGVPPGSVLCLAYAPDGHWLASTSVPDRHVRLWDLEGRQGERLIGSHSHGHDSVAYAPDGRMLATAGEDGAVRLWDLATGTERRRLGGPADRLYSVAFSPDGRLLAAAGMDADIRLWDLAEVLGSRIGP